MIDLNNLAKNAYEVAKLRESNGAKITTDTLGMLKHTATEVVEATDSYSSGDVAAFEQELSDIIMCCLIIAGKNGINIESDLDQCHFKNQLRASGKGDKK